MSGLSSIILEDRRWWCKSFTFLREVLPNLNSKSNQPLLQVLLAQAHHSRHTACWRAIISSGVKTGKVLGDKSLGKKRVYLTGFTVEKYFNRYVLSWCSIRQDSCQKVKILIKFLKCNNYNLKTYTKKKKKKVQERKNACLNFGSAMKIPNMDINHTQDILIIRAGGGRKESARRDCLKADNSKSTLLRKVGNDGLRVHTPPKPIWLRFWPTRHCVYIWRWGGPLMKSQWLNEVIKVGPWSDWIIVPNRRATRELCVYRHTLRKGHVNTRKWWLSANHEKNGMKPTLPVPIELWEINVCYLSPQVRGTLCGSLSLLIH